MEGLQHHTYGYVGPWGNLNIFKIFKKKLLQKSAKPRYEDYVTFRRTMFHYKQLCNESDNKSKYLILQLLDSCKAQGPFYLSCS